MRPGRAPARLEKNESPEGDSNSHASGARASEARASTSSATRRVVEWSVRESNPPLQLENGRDKIVYLDRLLVIGLASRSDLVLNSEPRHGSLATQALSQRLDRCPVGPPGTADAPTGPGGGPAKDRLPGSPRRGLLSAVDGLLLGRPASRLSPRGHGPLLLPSVAPGGVVGADPRHAPRHGPTAGGSSIAAQCRQHRQPDGQGHPHQRPEGIRRGGKKSTASSGTCWWTRSA